MNKKAIKTLSNVLFVVVIILGVVIRGVSVELRGVVKITRDVLWIVLVVVMYIDASLVVENPNAREKKRMNLAKVLLAIGLLIAVIELVLGIRGVEYAELGTLVGLFEMMLIVFSLFVVGSINTTRVIDKDNADRIAANIAEQSRDDE